MHDRTGLTYRRDPLSLSTLEAKEGKTKGVFRLLHLLVELAYVRHSRATISVGTTSKAYS